MKRSALKALGLTPEQIDAIMEENGQDIEAAKEKAKDRHDVELEKLQDKITKLQDAKPAAPKADDTKPTPPAGESDELKKLKDEIEKLKNPPKDEPKPGATGNPDTGSESDSELVKLKEEFDSYKANIEAEKLNTTKTNILTATLTANAANPKFIPLLMKEFDLSTLELEGEGEKQTIKGFDDLLKPVKESYADIFGKVDSKGADVANPPKGTPGKTEPTTILGALQEKYGIE